MKQFSIPRFYRAELVTGIKRARREQDPRKTDLDPTVISLPKLTVKLARHFGFCYGVENAIEIAYRAVEENPGKRVFLLSEMIHNRQVNSDLESRGVRFLQRTDGSPLISFDELTPDDIVIIPAFGTTVQHFAELERRGIRTSVYNATCPFVEKVWKRGLQLGEQGYTIIIHGKHSHEETRATFSHVRQTAHSLVIRDRDEAMLVARFIRGEYTRREFDLAFEGRSSEGFDPSIHLERLGVVNQTTMLAEETKEITEILKDAVRDRSGKTEGLFADTRDTLCYATSENQTAIRALVDSGGDIAVVVGGYNSSNSAHLVEICETKIPTFYIDSAASIESRGVIRHFDLKTKRVVTTAGWLPEKDGPVEVLVSAGASCPDSVVSEVLERLANVVHPELAESLESTVRIGGRNPLPIVSSERIASTSSIS